MHGVSLTPLKIIKNSKGDLFHCIKKIDPGFKGFGEAYFSSIYLNEIKGWTKHTLMTLNLVVNVGEVRFVIYDDRRQSDSYKNFFSVKLSVNNYQRLTIAPRLWVAMKGVGVKKNLVFNFADIAHDPNEHAKLDLNRIHYKWEEA